MNTLYFDKRTRAIADLIYLGLKRYLITRINVPEGYRGQGLGSKLLDQICADADAEQVKLVVHPVPSGPLNSRALKAWYRRRGFVTIPTREMERQPRGISKSRKV